MTHAEMDELYELFVLDALETSEAAEIRQHLRDGCSHCEAGVREATATMAALAEIPDRVDPPSELRERVLSSIRPAPQKRKSWTTSLAMLSAACVALVAVCLWLGDEANHLRARLSEISRERNALQEALKVLSRPDTRAVQFGKIDQPAGRVFVNRNGGLVFVASRLPKIGSDRTFQLWLVPPSGAPRSAGLFRSDGNGESVNVSTVPVDPTTTKAVAVSVEPAAGSTAPTTTPIIVAALE